MEAKRGDTVIVFFENRKPLLEVIEYFRKEQEENGYKKINWISDKYWVTFNFLIWL